MINLLERFYKPNSGKILYDNRNAGKVNLGDYRAGIALVQQEPVLYQGSIRDNIALGLLSTTPPSDDVTMAAATSANIHDFILSLPKGLNTPRGTLAQSPSSFSLRTSSSILH
ncbi:P-loop containing nucleoside triphosphate hydrolase protein [Colletotrichum tofieldiae]|nr:P-loop containing nucleoside triphosphate hydrolase protein [Colletotrichum tofieldiae]